MKHNSHTLDKPPTGTGPIPEIPKIVCLCGSTKFKTDYDVANKWFTLQGWIVLSVGFFGHMEEKPPTHRQKEAVNELHLRKIDIADLIYVVNPGAYIGDDTFNEINYAKKNDKPIIYQEPLCNMEYEPSQVTL